MFLNFWDFWEFLCKIVFVLDKIKPKPTQKAHSFWQPALKKSDLKMLIWLIWENHLQYLHEQNSQKELVFWVDSCWISWKTTFLLTILLVKVVFWNHHFQIWLFWADFQKEWGFWVDSGLISSKTMFLLTILLVKVSWRWCSQITFLNQYFQIWHFRADFQKECGFSVDSILISSKTTFLLRILLVKVVFSNHHLQIWLFRADFQKECGFWVDSGLISTKTMFFLRILLVNL